MILRSWQIKTIIAIVVIGALLLFSEATAKKCPGCGKKWDTSVYEYCFSCQAMQAAARSYEGSHSGQYYSSRKTCAYSNCDSECVDGGSYCIRHTCTVSSCAKQATTNTLFKYCYTHEKELTCAVTGCHGNRYMTSIYCNLHYPNGK